MINIVALVDGMHGQTDGGQMVEPVGKNSEVINIRTTPVDIFVADKSPLNTIY